MSVYWCISRFFDNVSSHKIAYLYLFDSILTADNEVATIGRDVHLYGCYSDDGVLKPYPSSLVLYIGIIRVSVMIKDSSFADREDWSEYSEYVFSRSARELY